MTSVIGKNIFLMLLDSNYYIIIVFFKNWFPEFLLAFVVVIIKLVFRSLSDGENFFFKNFELVTFEYLEFFSIH